MLVTRGHSIKECNGERYSGRKYRLKGRYVGKDRKWHELIYGTKNIVHGMMI